MYERVVLCGHIAPALLPSPVRGEYLLPWTYLHAIKDYMDMVAHLESVPEARAVVNFTPTSCKRAKASGMVGVPLCCLVSHAGENYPCRSKGRLFDRLAAQSVHRN